MAARLQHVFAAAVSLSCIVLLVGKSHAQEKDSAPQLPTVLAALLDRERMIATGLFRFRTSSYILLPNGSQNGLSSSEFTVAVDGSDWIQRYVGSSNLTMSRGSYAATYYQTGKDTQSENKSLTLGGADGPLTRGAEKIVWRTCALVGQIVVPSVRDYVARHWHEALASDAVVNDLPCRVFDFPIERRDFFKALTAVDPSMVRAERATIRLCVAEQFGGGLVRYEVIGSSRSCDVTEAREFANVGEGVYLPRHWKRVRGQPETGQSVIEIELLNSQFVNQKLPANVFEFKVPAGTRITDNRPGGGTRVFTIAEEHDVVSVEDAVRLPLSPKPTFPPRAPGRARLLIILNALVLTALLGFAWRRRLQKRTGK